MGRASRRKRERRFDGAPPPQPPATRRGLSDEQLAEARAAFVEREAEDAVVYERVCESCGQETFGELQEVVHARNGDPGQFTSPFPTPVGTAALDPIPHHPLTRSVPTIP